MLFIFLHCIACIHFLIVDINKDWVPPLWYVNFTANDLYTSSIERQYFMSFYISILMFGGNEIGGTTSLELAFTGLTMLFFSAIVNAVIFGEMAVLVETINRKDSEFQERIDTSNTAMKNLSLPDDIQKEVREFLIFTQGTLEQQTEMAKFFMMISSSLKIEVSQEIFHAIAIQNKIISSIVRSEVKRQSSKMFSLDNKDTDKEIISSIVKYLVVELKNPEDIVIEQNSSTRDMYFVAKGICTVQLVDQTKKLNKCVRNLLPGDHFGEIGLLYGTPRTATVLSKNYITLAVMSLEVYNDLNTDYPQMQDALKEHIYSYDDTLTHFTLASLRRVPYFQDINNEALYDVMYTLKKRFYDKGDLIQNVGEDADTMYLVLNGTIELYTHFESYEFVLERLWRGSIMNYRTFFQQYDAQVCSRCVTKTILLELPYEKMVALTKHHEDMEKKFLKFEKQVLKEKDKSYPLDYIMNIPEEFYEGSNIAERYESIQRENVFKNVVMRRLYEIRQLKAKPKLKDLLLKQMNTKNISDLKARIEIKKKIRDMCSKNASKQFEDDVSTKFSRLVSNLERVLKILTAENVALNNIESRLIEIPNKLNKGKVSKNKSVKKPKTKEKNKAPYKKVKDKNYESDSDEES